MPFLSVRLSEDEEAALVELATGVGRSKSDVARNAIRAHIGFAEGEPSLAERIAEIERRLDAAGR